MHVQPHTKKTLPFHLCMGERLSSSSWRTTQKAQSAVIGQPLWVCETNIATLTQRLESVMILYLSLQVSPLIFHILSHYHDKYTDNTRFKLKLLFAISREISFALVTYKIKQHVLTYPYSRGCRRPGAFVRFHSTARRSCWRWAGMCRRRLWTYWIGSLPG